MWSSPAAVALPATTFFSAGAGLVLLQATDRTQAREITASWDRVCAGKEMGKKRFQALTQALAHLASAWNEPPGAMEVTGQLQSCKMVRGLVWRGPEE